MLEKEPNRRQLPSCLELRRGLLVKVLAAGGADKVGLASSFPRLFRVTRHRALRAAREARHPYRGATVHKGRDSGTEAHPALFAAGSPAPPWGAPTEEHIIVLLHRARPHTPWERQPGAARSAPGRKPWQPWSLTRRW